MLLFFSSSSWEAIGKKDKEILIGGNKNNFGGGIIIKETKDRSNFEYVKFQFLNGLKKAFYSEQDKILYTSQTYYLDGNKNNFKERIIEKKVNQFMIITLWDLLIFSIQV